MIKLGHLASEQEILRFQAEAQAAARLEHPGIVPVHEVGVHQGQHYYAMDFVGGGSLAKLQRDEPVPIRRAADLVQELADAIYYAHQQGIVHRDLKRRTSYFRCKACRGLPILVWRSDCGSKTSRRTQI